MAAVLLCLACSCQATLVGPGIPTQDSIVPPTPGWTQAPDSDEHSHHHHGAAFLGGTHEDGDDGFTIGLEYEYRLREKFGIGGVLEYAAGAIDSTTIAAGLVFHPTSELALFLAPGILRTHGDNELVVRIGGGYEFPAEGYTITPALYFDFIEGGEVALIFGIAFGMGF